MISGRLLFAATLASILSLAPALSPAAAAPICQSREGDIVRCEDARAMPVGWKAPPDIFAARTLDRAPHAQASELVALGVVLLCIFAIIALLPRFDGAKDEDWERDDG